MIKVKRLAQLQRKLKRVQSNAAAMDGTHMVTLDVLFTQSFMLKYSRFSSVGELLSTGGFTVESAEHLDAIKGPRLNAWLTQETVFTSWEAMMNAAAEQYAARKLMAGL